MEKRKKVDILLVKWFDAYVTSDAPYKHDFDLHSTYSMGIELERDEHYLYLGFNKDGITHEWDGVNAIPLSLIQVITVIGDIKDIPWVNVSM